MAGATMPRRMSGALADWMQRVLDQCDRCAAGFAREPVHELRVALRRCRTMADSLMRIDPDPDWRRVRKIGGQLFRALGDLRDAQVMLEWAERIGPAGDPIRFQLLGALGEREAALKVAAAGAVEAFARRRWEWLAECLPQRIETLPDDDAVFESLALERWQQAFGKHRAALRRRSAIGWHELRIGVKRFRYVVENFLPGRHAFWGRDLKRVQDLLGEVHDLDVLKLEVRRLRPRPAGGPLVSWMERIAAERAERLAEYRARASGPGSVWDTWRSGLPDGEAILSTSKRRLAVRASLSDPDFRTTQRVTRLALDLYDGLAYLGIDEGSEGTDTRRLLETAALLHGTGRSRSTTSFQKTSRRMIRRIDPPPGWSAEELELVELVVRYHRGAVPDRHRADIAALDPERARTVACLAGILGVAAVLVDCCDPPPVTVDAERLGDVVQLEVTAGIDSAGAAGRIGAAAHRLGAAIGRPVFVRPRLPRG